MEGKQMSNTPRTDATAVDLGKVTVRINGEWVGAPFARQLERENTDLLEKLRAATSMPCARSATAAPSVWTCVYNGLVEKPCKVCDCEMKGYAPQAPQVEETAIGHARYEYIRTLNPRKFSALYNEALMGVYQFDDLVDRYRDAGGQHD
jgi:hypothetical protein